MHIRVPGEIEAAFEREIRKERFRLHLVVYPVIVVIASGFLIGQSHKVYYLFHRFFESGEGNDDLAIGFVAATVAVVAVASLWWLRVLSRRPLLDTYLYCSKCDALDFDEVGQCPCCEKSLKEKAQFLFTIYDGEIEIAKRYGLGESKRSSSQPPHS